MLNKHAQRIQLVSPDETYHCINELVNRLKRVETRSYELDNRGQNKNRWDLLVEEVVLGQIVWAESAELIKYD